MLLVWFVGDVDECREHVHGGDDVDQSPLIIDDRHTTPVPAVHRPGYLDERCGGGD